MKQLTFTILLAVLSLLQMQAANDVLRIVHGGITDYAPLSDIDSIYFDENGTTMLIQPIEKVAPISIARTDIQTMEYVSADVCPSKISIVYNGNSITAANPFLLSGVSITADGAYVTVKNSNISTEYTTDLSGSTTNGGFTYEGEYKTTIVLSGVSITSQRGAAIDIQCGKRVAIELKKNTINTLVDAANGNQKAAFYCKGHLEIDKTGTLNVTGNTKHAISAKEYIQLKKSEGTINILGAPSDGIHCGQYFLSNGYSVSIKNVGGDGIQAELSGDDPYEEDYADGSVLIQGGTYNIEVTAAGAAGIKADTDVTINSVKMPTNITITATGDDGRGIDANGNVTISDDATVITITNSGTASKGFKVGNSENIGTFTLNGGTITSNISGTMVVEGTDASYCSAIKTDHYVGNGGVLNVTAIKGNASRAISADESILITDGNYTIVNSCNGQAGTSDNYTAKALNCDKNITIEGGMFNIKMSGTGGKGIKADGELVIGKADGTGPAMRIATTGAKLNGNSNSGGTQPGGGGRPGGWGGGPGGGGTSSSGSSSKAIKVEGAAYVKGGNLCVTTATDGAEGLESKTSITISGGTHYFQCYDDCINSAGKITFAGGTTVCFANGNDAVDSNYGRTGAITISGGNVFAYSTKGGPEEGLDCDNNSYITITGGIAVSAGGSQGGGGGWGGSSNSSVGSASQGYFLGSSPSSYNTTYYYTLCNTSGEAICTYKFEGNVTNSLSLLTAPNLGKGSITVKQGTAEPTAYSLKVDNVNGKGVFFIAPTVTTTGTAATVTAK